VHHLDGAAGEAEGHGPQRTLAGPVCDLIKSGPVGMLSAIDSGCSSVRLYVQGVLHDTLLALLTGQRNVCGHALLHGWRGAWVALDQAGSLHGCRLCRRAVDEGDGSGASEGNEGGGRLGYRGTVLVAACLSVAGIEFHVPRRPRAIVERVAANMVTLVGCVYGRCRGKWRDGVEIMAGRCRCKWQWRRKGRDDSMMRLSPSTEVAR
jgi:hypothetical protein